VADALSRQPTAAEGETALEDLLTFEDTLGCAWYAKMRREVERDPAAHPDYCIRDERLHRHFWDMADSTEPELSDPWKLCVPKPARAAVLRECHDAPTAGQVRSGNREDNRPSAAPVLLARHVPRGSPVRPELPVLPTIQDAAAPTAGEDVPDTKPAAMGDSQHRPGGPTPSLQPR
jgi:hypothetical protein